ncbi:hypothetical protein DVH05_019140 [Phytophthora capsici]|nr:hypothetical protein DVH05_019140 [Phytophthora capsici]
MQRRLAPPPASIVCLACHSQYFSASLPIHQKACFQRNAFMLLLCEKCKSSIRACDFLSHASSCAGKPLPVTTNAHSQHQSNPILLDLNSPEEDGRVRCKTCERAFSQDRIAKHQSVCHAKPRASHEAPKLSQRLAIPEQGFHVKKHTELPRRKPVHIQRAVASRPRGVLFTYVPDRNTRQQSRGTSRQSSNYPGARAMQGGGWDTSNASSASNPLATNPLMTRRR